MLNQRKAAAFATEDPFAAGSNPPEMDEPRRVAKAYQHKQGPPQWMYMAMGIAFGMIMICLVYYVHSARAAAEIAKHHYDTHIILQKHRLGEHVSDEEHAEMLAKHGMHETDEDLRMHALEFFDHDNNKDAFHAGPDASKAEIESMDKNGDNAVSWVEYLNGFHNEKLMVELFHHYYGEIYGKGIPNHYHTERHPDAVVDHHELHELDKPTEPDHPDYLAPGEEWHGDPETHSSLELKQHLEELEKEEAKEKATKSSMKNV
jgi:hypothetical protein